MSAKYLFKINHVGFLSFAAFVVLFHTTSLAECTAGVTPVKIAPIGNSTTEGNPGTSSYRCWLWRTLTDSGYCFDFVGSRSGVFQIGNPTHPIESSCPYEEFDEDHEGHWGYEINELLDGNSTEDYSYPGTIGEWISADIPDIALIHLGSNDVLRGRDINMVVRNMARLVDTLRAHNPYMVLFIAQIMPSSWTFNENIAPYNQKLDSLANELTQAQSPVLCIDQNSGFSVGSDFADGVHPNESGEKKLAANWFEALKPVLSDWNTQPQECNLTVSVTGEGNVVIPDDILCREPLTLTAEPAQGYVFAGWSVSEDIAQIDHPESTMIQITLLQNDVTVEARFELQTGVFFQRQIPAILPAGNAVTTKAFTLRGKRILRTETNGAYPIIISTSRREHSSVQIHIHIK